jgi:hypothetical protein
LLLPWRGSGALALTNADAVADLPATLRPLPVSSGALALREIKQQLWACHVQPHSHARSLEWTELMAGYVAGAEALAARPAASWSDCVELAEIAWHLSPKESQTTPERGHQWIPRLSTNGRDQSYVTRSSQRVNVALIEAVLTLGGGERFDPKVGRV